MMGYQIYKVFRCAYLILVCVCLRHMLLSIKLQGS